jgi:hypothetical protein
MVLPLFPSTGKGNGTPSISGVSGQNTGTSDGIVTLVYGLNASNAVSHAVPNVNKTTVISADFFNTLINKTNTERNRRGYATIPASVTKDTLVFASLFNGIKTALEVPGPAATEAYNISGTATIVTFPQAPTPSGAATVGATGLITASNVNLLIDELNDAGAVCTCNCNYCTCNCNYCTCNCNYACTCNCNYSDERVKTSIEYM